MKTSIYEGRRIIADAAERSMRQLVLSEQIRERIHTSEIKPSAHPVIGPYIAISREVGAGGYEIGRRLGERMGWAVLARDLLDEVSSQYHLPRNLLDFVDEKPANWWHEMLGTLLDPRIVTHEAFVWHLGQIILSAASKGKVIIVGRGAQFILPREHGVSVRIIAPEKKRIDYLMQSRGMERAKALEYSRTTEKHRHDFIQRYFHHDVADPKLYDLIVNTEHVGIDGAVDIIFDLYQRGFERS